MWFFQKMLCFIALNFTIFIVEVYAQKVGGAIGGAFILGPFNSQPVEPLVNFNQYKSKNQVYSKIPFGSFSGIQIGYKSRSNILVGLQVNTAYWPTRKATFGDISVRHTSHTISAGYVFVNRNLFTIEANGVLGYGTYNTDINSTQASAIVIENGKILSPGLNEVFSTRTTNTGISVQLHKYFCNVPKSVKSKPLSTYMDLGLKIGWLHASPENKDYYQATNLFFATFSLGGGVLELTK